MTSRSAIPFRFAFAYFALFLFPFPLDAIPQVAKLAARPWEIFIPWVGAHVLHLAHSAVSVDNGSGDTTFAWVTFLVTIVIAAVIAIVWSIAQRHTASYPRLEEGLRIYLRYYLAFTMLTYGTYKIWKSQFPFPDPETLFETYGHSTPMGLLWTFMGYSTAYTFFGGLSECLGGVLLLWRRTTLLGALVSAGVLANVVMLNFCYDVPVKIYSSHLLVIALWIAAPAMGRCADLFLFNRPTEKLPERPPLPKRWMERARLGVKAVVVLGLLYLTSSRGREGWKTWGDGAPAPALYGVYDVGTYGRDGVTVPPLLTETKRWRRVFFRKGGRGVVERMDDTVERFSLSDDATKKALAFLPRSGEGEGPALAYMQPDEGTMVVDGKLDGEVLHVTLRKFPIESLPLVKTGFHWVNEFPNNR